MMKWWKKKMYRLAWKLPGNVNTLVCGTGRITYLRHRSPWKWFKWWFKWWTCGAWR